MRTCPAPGSEICRSTTRSSPGAETSTALYVPCIGPFLSSAIQCKFSNQPSSGIASGRSSLVHAGFGSESFAHRGSDPCANGFDALHELRMRQCRYANLETQSGDAAQSVIVTNDLLDYFFGVADKQRALRPSLRVEVSTSNRRPSALFRDRSEGADVAWEEIINRLLGCRRDIAQRVYADSQLIGRVSEPLTAFSI